MMEKNYTIQIQLEREKMGTIFHSPVHFSTSFLAPCVPPPSKYRVTANTRVSAPTPKPYSWGWGQHALRWSPLPDEKGEKSF